MTRLFYIALLTYIAYISNYIETINIFKIVSGYITIINCPEGYMFNYNNCKKCPENYYRMKNNATCLHCPEGYVSEEGSRRCNRADVYDNIHTLCNIGSVVGNNPFGVYRNSCKKCEKEYREYMPYLNNADNCLICPNGYIITNYSECKKRL